jgi:hypothetical protein
MILAARKRGMEMELETETETEMEILTEDGGRRTFCHAVYRLQSLTDLIPIRRFCAVKK